MESVNKIELVGSVGVSKINAVTGELFLTVATNNTFRNKEGYPIIETTWHNVRVNEKTLTNTSIFLIKKGDKVRVIGRLICQKYTNENGIEMVNYVVIASSFELLDVEKKSCSFDVYFSPFVNVKANVVDENNLTEEEEKEIMKIALDKFIETYKDYEDNDLYELVEKIEVYEVNGEKAK